MSKHGPTEAETIRELANALARALGKFSDEQWAIGPWFMSEVIVARKLADALVAGELDDHVKAAYEHMTDPDPRNVNNEVAHKWEPKK